MKDSDKTSIQFDVALIPDGGGGFIAEVPGFPDLKAWGEEEADALFMIEQELQYLIEEAAKEGKPFPEQDYVIRQVTLTISTQDAEEQIAGLKKQIQKGIDELDRGQVSTLTTEDIKTLARAKEKIKITISDDFIDLIILGFVG